MTYLPVAQETKWQKSNEIDITKTAVLVIDILGGDGCVIAGLETMAENASRIIKTAHSLDVPVIFACDAHIEGLDRELELWGEHGIANTEESKPLKSLGGGENDLIIPKRRYNAFYGTDLDLTLRELGVDTLIVTGCDTNICVMHTLAGAYYRTYKTIVAADACATFLIGSQEEGLDYFTRCFDSRVVNTEDVIKLMSS